MAVKGYTYMHEHVTIDLSSLKNEDSRLDCFDETLEEFRHLKNLGVDRILDVTNVGMGRNIPYMEKMRQEAGLDILYSTGFYQEMFYPPYVEEWDEEKMYAFLIKELTLGMEDSPIRARIIGEIGSSHNVITPAEERLLRASVRAHLDTGAPLSTHCSLGTMGHEQIKIFQEYTKDLSKIIIGHTDLTGDMCYLLAMVDQGVNIAFDTIGKNDYMPDLWRAKTLKSLVDRGCGDQIVLSMDITRKSHLKARGGLGYAYLIEHFVPMLRENEICSEAIDQILIHTPNRILGESRASH